MDLPKGLVRLTGDGDPVGAPLRRSVLAVLWLVAFVLVGVGVALLAIAVAGPPNGGSGVPVSAALIVAILGVLTVAGAWAVTRPRYVIDNEGFRSNDVIGKVSVRWDRVQQVGLSQPRGMELWIDAPDGIERGGKVLPRSRRQFVIGGLRVGNHDLLEYVRERARQARLRTSAPSTDPQDPHAREPDIVSTRTSTASPATQASSATPASPAAAVAPAALAASQDVHSPRPDRASTPGSPDPAEQAAAMSELSQAMVGEILTMPDLSDPEWDTYAMVAEVDDYSVGVTAYRYPAAGPPKPTRPPAVADLVRELRNRTRGRNGATWDVAVLKIHRDTAQLAIDFVSGADAEIWRITPTNISNLPELARPHPSDFGAA
ncbi:MAG TPA: hypothetical protein VIT65_07850 [Microlunatus sp.]